MPRYHFSIENLKHTCSIEGCEEKATTHITPLTGEKRKAGFFCSKHVDIDKEFSRKEKS